VNDDDRLSRYLSERAESITLTPADPAAVMRRGASRRNRRRGAVLGAVAVLGVVATSVAVYDDGKDPVEADTQGIVVAPSSLTWSVVRPESGLGYSSSQVELANGAVYGLSTAPGPYNESDSRPPTLYRTDDDAEWSPVSLPGYLRASSLAASGDTLYAIGTSPAGGGGRTLAVAASTDGADTWQRLDLPPEIAELDARHPGVIRFSPPTIAAQDASHLVASVVVSAQPDVEALLPDEDVTAGWEITPEGVTIHRLEDCGDDPACGGKFTDEAVYRESIGAEPDGDGTQLQVAVPDHSYTWEELGLDPEVRALITGRTYLYASDDGTTFQPVAIPGETSGWGSSLVAGPEGYVLFVGGSYTAGTPSVTHVYRSADGHSWSDGGTLPGSTSNAGLLGDRPAVALFEEDGGMSVRVSQPDGSWSHLDLSSALSAATNPLERWTSYVAFGPLGVAALVSEQPIGSEGMPLTFLVHSTDGTTVSAVSLDEALPERSVIAAEGLRVTADAIIVRMNDGPDGSQSTPPTQTLFIGTPA